MKILGIVAEYDPFHNGHLRHLREACDAVHPDLIFIALSGCFKQSGDLCMLSPSFRAALAVKAGADAVFELPVLWSMRDAENYALGAVSMLASLGCTHLAFGAENADIARLTGTARLLENPPDAFTERLRQELADGSGFPAAQSAAAEACLPGAGKLLSHPNNTLAVCYMRAAIRLSLPLEPVVIPRQGSYSAFSVDPLSPSAGAIRGALLRGSYEEAFAAVPDYTACELMALFLSGHVPSPAVFSSLLLSSVRSASRDELCHLPYAGDGLGNGLSAAARDCASRDEIISRLTTRRFTSARIKRLCSHAMLGITAEALQNAPLPRRARLLAFRRSAAMDSAWKELSGSVITSPLDMSSDSLYSADLRAYKIRTQCCGLADTEPFTDRMFVV